MTPLKPCPFCGGPVSLEQPIDRPARSSRGDWWGVVCRNTENLGGTCAIEQRPSRSQEAAIERWNRRADPAPVGDGKWEIDRSTDSPILTYEKCSVIQDEQAFYVLRLIEADQRPAPGENPWNVFTEADARYCAEDGTLLEVQCADREFRHKFVAVMRVGSPQWRSHVAAGNIVRWRRASRGAETGIISGNVLGEVPK